VPGWAICHKQFAAHEPRAVDLEHCGAVLGVDEEHPGLRSEERSEDRRVAWRAGITEHEMQRGAHSPIIRDPTPVMDRPVHVHEKKQDVPPCAGAWLGEEAEGHVKESFPSIGPRPYPAL
jgi:hypothetical protein